MDDTTQKVAITIFQVSGLISVGRENNVFRVISDNVLKVTKK